MVSIYMQDSGTGEWICTLNIPPEDVAKFSLRPLKWLRFVAFAALGAKGDLFDGPVPGSNLVNYETSHAELAQSYYYFIPDGRYRLVDRGLNSRTTSSTTLRSSAFRVNVAQRDGNRCAITGGGVAADCEVAHIIPHSKGDEYIQFVLSDRRSLYEDRQSHLENIGIDSTENGIYMIRELHTRFDRGASVFLKTPNFALGPADIPRVELGAIPASRTTIQHIEPFLPTDRRTNPQWDVVADWSGGDAPPALLLDFKYGAAAIKYWATPDVKDMLGSRHETDYKNPPKLPSSSSSLNSDINVESDNSTDTGSEYRPSESHASSSSEQSQDLALSFSMRFRGYPPGTTWQMLRQRQVEEAKIRSRQIGQDKVLGWLEPGHDSGKW